MPRFGPAGPPAGRALRSWQSVRPGRPGCDARNQGVQHAPWHVRREREARAGEHRGRDVERGHDAERRRAGGGPGAGQRAGGNRGHDAVRPVPGRGPRGEIRRVLAHARVGRLEAMVRQDDHERLRIERACGVGESSIDLRVGGRDRSIGTVAIRGEQVRGGVHHLVVRGPEVGLHRRRQLGADSPVRTRGGHGGTEMGDWVAVEPAGRLARGRVRAPELRARDWKEPRQRRVIERCGLRRFAG